MLFGITSATTACGPTPTQLARRAETLVQTRSWTDLSLAIDAEYGDPLGDRATLLGDLDDLDRTFARWHFDWTAQPSRVQANALVGEVETYLSAELVGHPVWRVEGPMTLAMHRTDQWRIQGGLLTDLRDIRGLMRARREALEANDAGALAGLLHPNFRDGLLDRTEAIQRLETDLPGRAVRLQVTNYRLEVRADLAHIDEYYVMRINGRPGRPSTAGLTLRKSAGRWLIAGGLYPPNRE